ncbi:MAG: ABC transporter substrate-binding protein [Alphaproteobacteria bacterium]|jgi:peptide/nickel transport system substrate-binding protein|nr:ABC transporter substrate-binding protein [Alphaproteobacteria bacterium]
MFTGSDAGSSVRKPLFNRLLIGLLLPLLCLSVLTPGIAIASTFRYAYQTDVNTLDPHALNESFTLSFLGNIYEGLVRRNTALELEPALAVRWEMLEPTRWRFHLRQGVRFHNGNAFNADDVIFSYRRAADQFAGVRNRLAAVAEIRRIDDHTVDVVTRRPSPTLIAEWSSWYIMDREWAETHGAMRVTDLGEARGENFANAHSNGTGPFRIVSREPDIRTVAEPFDGWWDRSRHNLTRVVFEPITADATRMAALRTGAMDLVYPLPVQDIARVESDPRTRALTRPGLRTIFLGMNQHAEELLHSDISERNPFRDRRVRLAVYQAIDVVAIRDIILRGQGRPAATLVAPEIEGYPEDIERYAHDPQAARRLLADAGYPDGFSVRLDCPNDRYINDEEICAAIGTMLGRVGIRVMVNAQPRSLFFRTIYSDGKYLTSFYLLGWSPSSLDSHNVLYNLVGSRNDNGQGVFNYGGFADPAIDALIPQIAVETDQSRRRALIREAWQRLHEAVGYIPLHQQNVLWGASESVTVPLRPDNHLFWRAIVKHE